MIIWISGLTSDFSAPLSGELVDSLTELGDAGYLGRHIILASREVLQHLSSLNQLSPRARAYFARVAAEYTQLGHVLAYPRHIVASQSTAAPVRYGDVWHVPLQLFAASDYSLAATIVCENDTDFEVLQTFADAFVRESLLGCTTHARSHAGGGANTATVVRRLLIDPNPVVACILDSDREVVLGAEGSTARGVRRVWAESWRSELVVLSSRELENVIPLELMSAWAESEKQSTDLIDSLELVHEDVARYVCLKSGEKVCRFHDVDPAHAGYQRTMDALDATGRSNYRFSACGSACADCNCRVIPRLGDRFLERFAAWIRIIANRRRIRSSATWATELRDVVKVFVGVSLALPRRL